MRVLVTGATGFVGRAISFALLRHGHGVLAFVRDPEKARDLLSAGAAIARGDMWQPDTYVPLVAEVDAVIHAAQIVTKGRFSRVKIVEMHVSDAQMTAAVAGACADQGKAFIYTSGALTHAKYGGEWIEETATARPCLLAHGHAEREAELLEMHRDRGLKAMIVSPGFVYGPGGFLLTTAKMLQRGRYRMIGRGDNFWSLVHVDDVGEAFALALERGRPGECYFLADEHPMLRRDFINAVAAGLGVPPVGNAPAWLMKLLAGPALVEALTSSFRVRADKAHRELGWTPRYESFAAALPDLLPQFRSEGSSG
ncbi:MAG: NAD-dependent epimerase/dehydratase family protein [Pirellulales bacterium]|nr:NAD-dependent epimerase/dehydratase family protein [Pirellulales bacterium]